MDNKENRIVYGFPKEEPSILMECYHTIVEQTNLLVYDIHLKEDKIYINGPWEEIYGITCSNIDKALKLLHLDYIHPEDKDSYQEFIDFNNKNRPSKILVYRRLHQSGSYIWVKNSRKNYYNVDGTLERIVGTEQVIIQDNIEEMDDYHKNGLDPVTKLYNRETFEEKAQQVVSNFEGHKFSIIEFDIDNFKVINDIHGTNEGDRLLYFIGQVVTSKLPEQGLVCRLYSDHFAILLPYKEEDEITTFIKNVDNSISSYAIRMQGLLSFGICRYDGRNPSISSLCDYASLAKKMIKGNVLHLYVFYDEDLRTKALYEQRIEHDMMDALIKGQFEMYLQPKVSIATSEVVGAEALVRWNHPQLGLIYPDSFIPVFERNGFVTKMDYYIWERAFATIQEWRTQGKHIVPISMNVSRQHIYDIDFVDTMKSLALKYKVPTYMIELELTETTYFDNLTKLSNIIQQLRDEGFILSIDDFGSGYTSLNLLIDTPVDVIKFDKNFIQEIETSERSKIVIQYIISMAKQLNIKVVAEGIEELKQAQFMLEAGCDVAQGYYYSRPLQLQSFEKYTFGNN